ncbi:MAG: hypothetical protein CSA32_02685 [Desulfobulbus propionicus]|nr:MAG: hypothetical protein CSA32_02685 [Desulfobulbus propionicus]
MKVFISLLVSVTAVSVVFADNLATDQKGIQDGIQQHTAYSSVEERRLMEALQEERGSLKREREELANQKKALKTLEEEVDKKLKELGQQRQVLEAMLKEKDAQELKRIKELSKMYEKMAAEKAARIFTTLDEPLAIAILEQMKSKSAAKLLNNMDRDQAAALTTAFSSLEIK